MLLFAGWKAHVNSGPSFSSVLKYSRANLASPTSHKHIFPSRDVLARNSLVMDQAISVISVCFTRYSGKTHAMEKTPLAGEIRQMDTVPSDEAKAKRLESWFAKLKRFTAPKRKTNQKTNCLK